MFLINKDCNSAIKDRILPLTGTATTITINYNNYHIAIE